MNTDVFNKVNTWAQTNASNDYYYGTRYSYWHAALTAGICTKEEFDYAENHYGRLWTYRGD